MSVKKSECLSQLFIVSKKKSLRTDLLSPLDDDDNDDDDGPRYKIRRICVNMTIRLNLLSAQPLEVT